MNKLIILISIFILSINSYAQKMPIDYFKEGMQFYEKKNYYQALENFRYITIYHTRNQLYPRAVYNMGIIFMDINKIDSAIYIFKKILNSNFSDLDPSGGDIMSSPYANFKNNSASILSEIYEKKQIWDTALYFLSISDTLYQFQTDCANDNSENKVNLALKYSFFYKKLNQIDNSINILLKNMFYIFANTNGVVDSLKPLLLKEYSPFALKKELEKSINNIDSVWKQNSEGYEYYKYYLTYLNNRIDITKSANDKFSREIDIKEGIKNSYFYKMIMNL